MKVFEQTKAFYRRGAAVPLGIFVALALVACGASGPEITSVSVNPAAFTINGLAANPTFTISCDVLHFQGDITAVTATVEGQSITVNLKKTGGVLGDENWSGSTQILLFTGASAGVWHVDVTAEDSNGSSQTLKDAAQVTITG